ncbi:MAG: T9SS type A sorting domain-containing protein [Chitinophagaceae bacterium]|nr:MAG: T9SS type A sorting domain-containing protein [Chitinophagaceae bacterium]
MIMSPFYFFRSVRFPYRPFLLAGFFLFLFQASALGQHLAINDGNWNNPATWDLGSVPGAGDAVSIASGVTVTVDVAASAASVQINNGSNLSPATLSFNTGTSLTVTGFVSLGAGNGANGILDMTNGGTLTASGFAVNSLSAGSLFTPGTGSVLLTANNSLPAIFNSFYNLTLQGNGLTTNAGNTVTISNALSIGNGATLNMQSFALVFSGAVALSNLGTIQTANTSATPIPAGQTWGDIPSGLGAVLFNAAGGGQTVPDGTYNNLYVSHSDASPAETVASGNIITGGEIATLTQQTTLNLQAFKLSNHPDGGIGSQNNVGTIRTQYIGPDPLPSGRNWGGTIVYDASSGGQKVVFGTYDNLTVSTNGTTIASTIVVNGDLVTSPTTILDINSETLTGSFDATGHQGILETSATTPFPTGKTFGGTVLYNSNVAQNIVEGNYNNLTITTFRSGDLTLPNGTIGVAGDLDFNATLEGTATFVTTGNVFNFNGAGPQSISVTATEITPTVPFVFNSITLSGGGDKTLASTASLNGILTLSDGVLETTTNNLLTLNDGATAAGGSTSSYLQGPLRRIGITAFTFPLGGAGVYAPLGISAPGAGGDFTARYVRNNPRVINPTLQLPLKRISRCEYWNVVKNGGADDPTVTLTWSPESPCDAGAYITNPGTLVVARYDGSAWVSLGGTASGGASSSSGSIESGPTSEYGNITLGSTDVENPLPVKFISIRARKQGNGVAVSWKTATEYNVDHYEIERSTDGRSFSTAAQVRATVNNGGGASYEGLDGRALNGTAYYRVKAVDIDGKLTFSTVVRLSDEKAAGALTIYPNPVRNRNVVFQASDMESGIYEVTIVDVAGRVVLRSTLEHNGGTVSRPLPLPAGTAPGLYSLRVSGNGQDTIKSFLVQ